MKKQFSFLLLLVLPSEWMPAWRTHVINLCPNLPNSSLLLQLLSPLLLVVLPIGAASLASLNGRAVDRLPGLLGIVLLSVYPSINSCLTLGFVAPYRRFLAGRFRRLVGKRKKRSVSVKYTTSLGLSQIGRPFSRSRVGLASYSTASANLTRSR